MSESNATEGNLIVQFCNIAGVDENLARYFLTQSKWDLQVRHVYKILYFSKLLSCAFKHYEPEAYFKHRISTVSN